MIRGLVLDVDDTLYLERDYVRSGFNAVEAWCADELGVRGVGARAWSLFESGRRGTTLTDALTHQGVSATPELTQRLVHVYRSHQPTIRLLPDAEVLLSRAQGSVPISVVTDGPAESQRAKVAALALSRWAIPAVVTAEHASAKPDPAMFRLATHDWIMKSAEIVYVADNPFKDFGGPLSLGWQVIRVLRPGSLHEAVRTPGGVTEVSDLTDRRLMDALP